MLELLAKKANNLPLLPGVYIMKDKDSAVIYVGKAKQLKNRVSSYFHGEHLPKVEAMVKKVRDFDVIVANSEFEALVLENSLIKRHRPQYNILLKDDKGYPFIKLETNISYPKFRLANRDLKDGAKYFGPFGSRGKTYSIIDTISKLLNLPTCNKSFPKDFRKSRPCLNYHMGHCRGWCSGEIPEEEYNLAIKRAQMILSGNAKDLIKELETAMYAASDEMNFEQAADLRDRIKAVKSLTQKQRVISAVYADTDAIGFHRGAKTCFAVLHYVDGDLADKNVELMEEPLENDAEAISKLLVQYYSKRTVFPKYILLQMEIDDVEAMEQYLSDLSGRRVYVETPKRGDRQKLVETARVNAEQESERASTAIQKTNKTLEWLKDSLVLDKIPERIEAFDVSNLGNEGIVAAMTVFSNGKALKRDYRKFKIKDVVIQDDYASMHEAVYRRFSRAVNGDIKFAILPDLLLIDGGVGHVRAAEEALNELGLNIPTYGMVKDSRHKTNALVNSKGEEISIRAKQLVYNFIFGIQEETHRFAIEYQRSLRNEKLNTGLQDIKGVGEKRRNELLMYFKTVKAIKEASINELSEVVPKNVAETIHAKFHSGEDK